MTDEYQQWLISQAHDYLTQVRGAQARINSLASSMAEIYIDIANIKAIDYSIEKTSGGEKKNLLVDFLNDKDERLREMQRQAHELELKVRRALYCLGKMEDQDLASILEEHYINRKSWQEISVVLSLTDRGIRRRKARALIAFYNELHPQDKTEIPESI